MIAHIKKIGSGQKTVATRFGAVKEEILRRIGKRIWPPGHTIPGEIELAEEFGCARATVNRAMRELSDEGFLERRRRAGTRVKMAPERQARLEIPLVRTEIEASGAAYRYALIESSVQAAPDWLRARLELPAKAKVLHVRCLHFADGLPYQFEDRWINVAAVPAVLKADLRAIGPGEWLVNTVPFTTAEFGFFAEAADAALAAVLSVGVGEAIFVAERITWRADKCITFARMSFRRGYRMTTRI